MHSVKIKPGIYCIGVNDRTTDLFEGLWPIAGEGVSYNSYLIKDKKNAVIDLSKEFKTDDFLSCINKKINLSDLDYVIINHMEPDHSGTIKILRKLAPEVKIVGSARTGKMLETFFGISKNIRVVKDGETLSLGKRTLRFISTPFIHWPETIMTYEQQNKILFSSDSFGAFGALHGGLFDDECRDMPFYEKEALRYYVNVIAKYSKPLLKAIDKLQDVPVDILAPAHGLVWRKKPQHIIKLYKKWAEFSHTGGEPGITLLYGSMYGNTERFMDEVIQGLSHKKTRLDIFDVARTHISYILPSLWKNRGLLIGSPTYEGELFPPVRDALNYAYLKNIKMKKVAAFGSYGWHGAVENKLQKFADSLEWEIWNTRFFNGRPTRDDLNQAYEWGRNFAESIPNK